MKIVYKTSENLARHKIEVYNLPVTLKVLETTGTPHSTCKTAPAEDTVKFKMINKGRPSFKNVIINLFNSI